MEGPRYYPSRDRVKGIDERASLSPSTDPWDWPAELPGKVYIPTYDEEYKIKELLK